jgi:TPR repeat protein
MRRRDGNRRQAVQDEEVFADAFGAFFGLAATPERVEPALDGGKLGLEKEACVSAIEEYRRAAEAGSRSAQEMLGLMYLYGSQLYGKGVTKNLREAARWLELAAAQDSVLARQLLRRYVLCRTDRGPDPHDSASIDSNPNGLGATA